MTRRTAPSRPSHRHAVALAGFVALCLLLSGVAPAVSRALAAAGAPGLHDLCVADGSRSMAPVGHHGDTDEAACAMCSVHGGSHAAPGGTAAVVCVSASGAGPVARAPAGAPPGGDRIAREPRGPPSAPARA
jgi:hypothetical protein